MTIKARTRRESFARALSIGGALVTVAGLAYLFLTPKIFQASARIQVSSFGHAQNNPADAARDAILVRVAECEFMRSDAIFDPVIQSLRLNDLWGSRYNNGIAFNNAQSRVHLQTMADIHPAPGSSVIQIQISSRDREEPARIANEITRAYSDSRQARRQNESHEKMNLLKQQWEAQNAKVVEAQAALEKLSREIWDERATDSTIFYDPQSYELLQNKHAELETEYVNQKSTLDQYTAMDRKKLTQVLSTLDENTNSVLISSLIQLNRAEAGLIAAQNDRDSNSPQVVSANLAVGKLRKNVDDAVNGVMFGLNGNLVSLKASLDELSQRLDHATTNSSRITAQDSAYAGALQKLETLKNEQDVLQKKLEQSDRLSALATVDGSPDILDLAELPVEPVSPNRRVATNVIFTGCFAIMAGLLLLVSAPKPKTAPAKA